MSKSKGHDTSFVCYQPDPQDYLFMPLLRLNTDYVVGVNTLSPVIYYYGPQPRREAQARARNHDIQLRREAGEAIPDVPRAPPRKFAIDDRGRFSFGNADIIVTKERELKPGEIRVTHSYDYRAGIHPDDEIDVELRCWIAPKGANTYALSIKLD